MTTKTYTNRSNAARAAKKAHGQGGYVITGGGAAWTFHAKGATTPAAEKPAPKSAKEKRVARTGGKKRLQDQPQMRKAIKLMQRANGVSVDEGSQALGTNKDTFRGMVSRLRAVVSGITVGREFSIVRYRLDPESSV